MPSANNDSFTSSFPICLIAAARTSFTMLNKHGESGHPCPVPDLKGNAFSFCPLSMILAVGFYMWPLLLFLIFIYFLRPI